MHKLICCALALLFLLGSTAGAEPQVIVAARAVNTSPTCAVAPGSSIDFQIVEHLGSKLSRQGDVFHIRATGLIDPAGQTLVAPGATGMGEVIHAARARAGGKAGELILAVRYLDCDGIRLPLRRFRFGRSGDSERDAAFALALAGGVLAFLVVGGEVDVPPGTAGFALVATQPVAPTTDTPTEEKQK